jgi:CBS domain-containing protein
MITNTAAIASRIVVVANTNTPVLKVAQLMREHHVGALVVVDDAKDGSHPVGIITDRDLVVEVLAKDFDYSSLRAGDIMTPDPVAARASAAIHETVERMQRAGVRRLPVVDDLGRLVGIVTFDDVIEFLAQEFTALATTLRQERRQEQRLRS